MSSSPPRLNINPTDPAAQPGYAPISWTAVASLAVAILFAILLLVMGYLAWSDKQPLLNDMLMALPGLAILLAFVSRRQIASSEGTRTGIIYANVGWWIAVVGGLGYIAYRAALDFDINQQAKREFDTWTKPLKDLDASNPKDPKLYEATYLVIEPGVRKAVKSPENISGMDSTFGDRIAAFRQLDLIRICARNRGQVEFQTHGLQDWQQKPTEIGCALAADLITPEGEHHIVVPLRAQVDEKTKQRSWHINPPPNGFVFSRKLTRYGWMIEHIEYTAKLFGQEFQGVLMSTGQTPLAFLGYVYPGMTPADARRELAPLAATNIGRAALGGVAVGSPFVYPKLSEYEARLHQVFALPNGVALTPHQFNTFMACWDMPGRIGPAGSVLKGNLEQNAILYLDGKSIEYRIPIELALLGDSSATQAAARGRLVLRPDPASEATILKELAAAKEQAATGPRTDEPPPEMAARPGPAWRVLRIESDLIPQYNPKGGPGGPRG